MTRQDVALLDRIARLNIQALQLQTDLVDLRWALAARIGKFGKFGKPKQPKQSKRKTHGRR